MADNKLIVFAVVALVVGIGIGAGVGYAAFNKPADTNETYWFYIDYNDKETNTLKSKWISASAESPLKGLTASLDKAGIEYEIKDNGWIISISGVASEGLTFTWGSWFWKKTNYDTKYTSAESPDWLSNPGFDSALGTVFYVGFTGMNPEPPYNYTLDPNAIDKWKSGGPFATA